MQITQVTTVLESAVCLIILVLLGLKLWPGVRLDSFRQKMFDLRAEMFDYAASGKIDFNDPAYRQLRRLMNGFIRYGHQLTFYRIILTNLEVRLSAERPEPWAKQFEKMLQRIKDQGVRNELARFHQRALVLATGRVILGSPMILLVLGFAIIGFLMHRGLQGLKIVFNQAVELTASKFLNTQQLEDEAANCAA